MPGSTALSVVIPLYNKRAYIERCVRSVLAQEHADFSLLIVDDGSTDGSIDVVRTIADPRIRTIQQPNAGVASARNRGIAEAQTAWVALLDADDYWKPQHLSEIARMIAAYPDAGIVAPGVIEVREGVLLSPERPGDGRIREIDYYAAAADDILVVNSTTIGVRREAVLAIGGFRDLRPGQDIDCWSRIALDWPVISSTRQTAYYERDTGGAINSWASRKRMRDDIERLEQFGGSVQSLAHALDTGRYEAKRSSIERYIDERILSGAGKCITLGDTANARNRLRFVHDKRRRKYRAYRALAALPSSLAIGATRGIALLRTARRAVRRQG